MGHFLSEVPGAPWQTQQSPCSERDCHLAEESNSKWQEKPFCGDAFLYMLSALKEVSRAVIARRGQECGKWPTWTGKRVRVLRDEGWGTSAGPMVLCRRRTEGRRSCTHRLRGFDEHFAPPQLELVAVHVDGLQQVEDALLFISSPHRPGGFGQNGIPVRTSKKKTDSGWTPWALGGVRQQEPRCHQGVGNPLPSI